MAGHISRCKVPGYEATFNLLNDFEKNSIEYDENEKFIHYLAALEFHDIVGIWDAFDAYTNDVIIKQELERLRAQSDETPFIHSSALRHLSLNLSSLFIYFGYYDAGIRSLNQVKRLAYANNDIETLHIVLLWMSNIQSIEIPERKDSPSNLIGMSRSLRSVKQKLQLHTVKNQLANNVPLDKCLANVTKWLVPNETAILPPFLSYLLIKVSYSSLLVGLLCG